MNTRIKKILHIVEWIFFALLLIVLFLVASPLLPTKNYISTYVVATGSMEPAIKTGSVVFSTQSDDIQEGDVIVFTSPLDAETIIIHRVIDIEEYDGIALYITKGDNNETQDNWKVDDTEIKGEMIMHVPYLGYVINWLKTPAGFITLLILPAILLVLSQIKKIKEGINEEVERKTAEAIKKKENSVKSADITIMLLILSGAILFFNNKNAYALFTAEAALTNITIKTASIPSVIINEVMWTGTELSPNDQWIELKNTTDQPINIGQWRIENARGENKQSLMIPANKVIEPQGYFLITSYPSQSVNTALAVESNISNASIDLLNIGNFNLILTDANGNYFDSAVPILNGTSYHSWQRVNDFSNGADKNNWRLCTTTDTKYWKTEIINTCGTPGE